MARVAKSEIVTVVFVVRDYAVGIDRSSREVCLVAVCASADRKGIGVCVSGFEILLWGVVVAGTFGNVGAIAVNPAGTGFPVKSRSVTRLELRQDKGIEKFGVA